MLHDLFMVELYFEPHTHGHKVDDMVRHYGAHAVEAALMGGSLELRNVKCDARAPRALCYLSAQARADIREKLSI